MPSIVPASHTPTEIAPPSNAQNQLSSQASRPVGSDCGIDIGRLALGLLVAWLCVVGVARAEVRGARVVEGGNAGAAATTTGEMQVHLGLAGAWKVGHVTPVRVDLPGQWQFVPRTIEIQTVDGDGVQVVYRTPINRGPPPSNSVISSEVKAHWCMVTIGRADRPVTVRVLDRDGNVIRSSVLSGELLGKALPTSQPWVVAIGSSLGIEETSFTLTDTGLSNFTTTRLRSAAELPDQWRGLSGCDILILSSAERTAPTSATQSTGPADSTTAAPAAVSPAAVSPAAVSPAAVSPAAVSPANTQPVLDDLSPLQWMAITDWSSQGGLLVVSLGKYAMEMPADSPLRNLLPGPVDEHLTNIDAAPLEAATMTNFQLPALTATRLKDSRGKVELALMDNSSRRFPWWVRYTHGKGLVHFVASDLDQPVMKQWKDRRVVWDKILASFWSRDDRDDNGKVAQHNSGSSFLGYDDMVGQLRATLDYFPSARIFSFGAVTGILALLLIVIGPVDYWISVRWLKRPSFSWIFSGLVLLASSLGLIWLESVSRPRQLLLNSAQVVDFMPEQQRLAVDSWTHIYSSRARTIDAALTMQHEADSARLDWQGLPGKGLGGMESNLLTDQNMPRYTVSATATTTVIDPARASEVSLPGPSIEGVGIPASGTKCLFATWGGSFEPSAASQLVELKGIDQIQGTLVNPLPYAIRRPLLIYHNWAYNLPSQLRPGEEIAITYEMVPKDFQRRLNRRQVVNATDVITRWAPEERQSLDRLLEMMMFYKASGGADYTKLKHRFQPRMDISSAITLDHAVLVGQLEKPLGQIALTNMPEDQVQQESTSTWCRVLLPVARAQE